MLPRNHRLFRTPLYTEPGLLNRLKTMLITGLHSTFLTATGIPPFIHIHAGINDLARRLENVPGEIISGVEETLHRNGAAAGNITRDLFNTAIDEVVISLTTLNNV